MDRALNRGVRSFGALASRPVGSVPAARDFGPAY